MSSLCCIWFVIELTTETLSTFYIKKLFSKEQEVNKRIIIKYKNINFFISNTLYHNFTFIFI